jgi:hypothetical protein
VEQGSSPAECSEDAIWRALSHVRLRSPRHPRRLIELQRLCAAQIEAYGGPASRAETLVCGGYEAERWDVASTDAAVPLAIGAKCLTTSRSNNVRHRFKEMMAEALNVRCAQPLAVLGFICVISVDDPARRATANSAWNEARIGAEIARRCRRPNGELQHFDLGCVLLVSWRQQTCHAITAGGLTDVPTFLADLTGMWRARCGSAPGSTA